MSLVPGAVNFRDVGGLRAGSSATRPGVLFRSGNLARLDAEGVAALRGLGIRRIIDLRADDEVRFEPSALEGLEVDVRRVPLFFGSVASFFEENLTLADMYRHIVDEAAERVVEVVRGVVEQQPVLVHCTVGKDRTGVTVAFALVAAGVDEDAAVADYARTETLLPERRNRRVLEVLRSMHPEALHLEELATRSPAPVMAALLADVRGRFGSVGEYLLANGLTEAELVELRRVLVAP